MNLTYLRDQKNSIWLRYKTKAPELLQAICDCMSIAYEPAMKKMAGDTSLITLSFFDTSYLIDLLFVRMQKENASHLFEALVKEQGIKQINQIIVAIICDYCQQKNIVFEGKRGGQKPSRITPSINNLYKRIHILGSLRFLIYNLLSDVLRYPQQGTASLYDTSASRVNKSLQSFRTYESKGYERQLLGIKQDLIHVKKIHSICQMYQMTN